MSTKLIILRGPSGAGKSTVARHLMQQVERPTALVDLDYYRFCFVNPPQVSHNLEYKLSKSSIITCLQSGFDVIFDGNFVVDTDDSFLTELFVEHPDNNYLFYLDVSLDETLARHENRTQIITAEKMRQLYERARPTGHINEAVIPQYSSLEQTISLVRQKAGI